MEKTHVIVAPASTGLKKTFRSRVAKDQHGFTIVEFLIFAAIIALIALLVIPNLNLFLGVDKKLAAANVEALNVKAAVLAYETNHGKYPSDSDSLWNEPPKPGDYIGQPRAYYTFDIGTGRIINATTDTVGHVPNNPWTGIRWDYTSGSWVK